MSDTIHHYNCVNGEWFHSWDCPGCKIEFLRAELAEKDKRIEELESGQSGPNNGPIITTEQIDKAWGCRIVERVSDPSQGVYIKAELLNIVACKECGGGGLIDNWKGIKKHGKRVCPSCDGHGWVVSDE